ncbi:MAG: hypothetical protein RLZZ557_1142 [Bacteroidota bacterium]
MRSKTMWLRICVLTILMGGYASGYTQQVPVQQVKGFVVDRALQRPLRGATVVLEGASPIQVLTDSNGYFIIRSIPVGRYALRITHVGFLPAVQNLVLEAGKELGLQVELEDDVAASKEIVVRSKVNKSRAINEMAMVSGRMFSVEETRRFAAGLNDPSRIATAFAGVSGAGDGNALIIRGNAPNGLLWRMEGVDIPNPNHFARVGTSGGAISILSAQLLANSDFLSGAFPAEYGNVLSGVFDIKLRKGNKDKREHTFSVSTIGVDFATEGYFKKGYGGSYLINYRYGFLTLMQKLGFNISDAATSFQDLSFNIHLPVKKFGSLSIFGFGGLSKQDNELAKNLAEWQSDQSTRRGSLDQADAGVAGIAHQIQIGRKSMLRTIYSLNGYGYREEDRRLDAFAGPIIYTRKNRFAEANQVLSTVFTYKPVKKHLFKLGAYTTGKSFDLLQRETAANALRDKLKMDGNTRITNWFVQWKWDPHSRVALQFGLHGQHFSLNSQSQAGPRAGLKFMVAPGQSLSFGMGWHAQTQPLGNYFARIRVGNDTIMPNQSLAFSKAKHFVLGYAIQLAANWNLKTELYYQWLYRIPVHAVIASSYSVINMEDDFAIERLANKGKGQNTGIEMTLERFWNNRFYLMGTMSLYQSKYLASDRIWRNTRYNSNSSITLLTGREWQLGKNRTSSLGIDLKMIAAGGVRVTPIDLARSIQQRNTVYVPGSIYADKLRPIFRIDMQVQWKVQRQGRTGSFILGMQNATNRKNQISQRFDAALGKIVYSHLLARIPVFGFKVDF